MSRAISRKRAAPVVALAVVLAGTLSLAGCEGAKRALGWERVSPDEFQVMQRAPLSQPPDYDLRPPMPGEARPQEGTTRDQAESLLTGKGMANVGTPQMSGGELGLLKEAGAAKVPPNIRAMVDQETTALVEADKSFTDELLFWRKKEKPGEVVDAAKEAKRLAQDAALGKPPTAGDTPTIVRRQKALFEGVF